VKRRAFVLASTGVGTEETVRSELLGGKLVRGVVGAYVVYGFYDLIVEVEAETEEVLREVVFSIRRLDHIESTVTLIQVA
jgi:uncharacterized protein with GYD domain